jgi:hypothetical protein|tara:strand:- start:16 stop:351 length:336 start_codon:yes stop_codon:yes gene_type:complete
MPIIDIIENLLINLTETSFLEKKKAKKRALSTPYDNFKTIFNNYDIKEFSEIGNSRGHSFQSFRSCHALQALASFHYARENEQRLKRKSLQDFPKLISHPARKLAGEINFP